jgi:hypothetical protein
VNRSDQSRRPIRREDPTRDAQQTQRRAQMPNPLGELFGDIDEQFPIRDDRRPARPPAARPDSALSGGTVRRTPERPPVGHRSQTPVPAPRRAVPDAVAPTDRMGPPPGRTPRLRRQSGRYPGLLGEPELLTSERMRQRPAALPPPRPALNLRSLSGVAAVSLIILAFFLIDTLRHDAPFWSRYGLTSGETTSTAVRAFNAPGVSPPGDYRLKAAPSLSPAEIDRILAAYGSPAVGTGQAWHDLGVRYGIDPAFAVAFFIHESSAGTNPNWAGVKPGGGTTHNVGNIICAGYPTCYGRFRDYDSWETGIEDWYRLIDREYIQGRGLSTVAEVIPIYAPAIENDVQGYIDSVADLVDDWRLNGVR